MSPINGTENRKWKKFEDKKLERTSAGARVWGDKAFNRAADEAALRETTGIRLIPIGKVNMQPPDGLDEDDLKGYRKGIETLNSQWESLGLQRLRARTNLAAMEKIEERETHRDVLPETRR